MDSIGVDYLPEPRTPSGAALVPRSRGLQLLLQRTWEPLGGSESRGAWNRQTEGRFVTANVVVMRELTLTGRTPPEFSQEGFWDSVLVKRDFLKLFLLNLFIN